MKILSEIRKTLLPGKILAVQVGFSRTAVLAETANGLSCGLAATLTNPGADHRSRPAVRNAGHLLEMSADELAGLVESDSHTEIAIGLAAINALLPFNQEHPVEMNADEYLLNHAVNKNVAMVGHFPFVEKLKPNVKNLWVLELNPHAGDYPAEAAPELVPQADVVVITATTLINHTLEGLLALCRPEAKVMLLGPSTPLSPVFFAHGVDVLCGTVVVDPHAVILGIGQGSSSRQLQQAGVTRMVTVERHR